MTTRAQRELKRLLGRLKLSPEQMAATYPASVAYYSGRQIRRWLEGHAMPDHAVDSIRATNATLDTGAPK